MSADLLFAPVDFARYHAGETLPARFDKLLDASGLADQVKGLTVAIKMHVGRGIGYTTVPPLFVRKLVQKLKAWGARPFVTDQEVDDSEVRGYTSAFLGCPVVACCGVTGKYFHHQTVDFKTFTDIDIAGEIADADFLIDLSHVKGHGACGYGGACKNLSMGCVTDRTRAQQPRLEGGLEWDKAKCTRCNACIDGCNHNANKFNEEGEYNVFFHHCTFCQHCVKVCPTGAVTLDNNAFDDFQYGMALTAKAVLDCFTPDHTYFINFLINITALCDCWGLSTPSLVPDIGVIAGRNMVAVERASLDAIKTENFIAQGALTGTQLSGQGHLFQQIHGKDPFVQLRQLTALGCGEEAYNLREVR